MTAAPAPSGATADGAPAPTLNLVGCGRVGRTLARLWQARGVFAIQDVRTRSLASAQAAVESIGAGRAVEADGAMRPAAAWMLAVPDGRIAAAADAVAQAAGGYPPAIAFHCSGFLAAEALAALRPLGWPVASAHPALSFASPEAAARQFPGTPCALEGDAPATDRLRDAFAAIGGQCFALAAEHKPLYHAAAVFASNFAPVLLAVSQELWRDTGVPAALVPRLSRALLRHCTDNALALGPARALTGPAARGDAGVVEAQAQAVARWDGAAGEAYRALSALAVRVARDGGLRPPGDGDA